VTHQIDLGIASTGEHVFIDIPTLVSTRLLVTASSGGGKSETMRRILEEAVAHIQCIVIDPEGEFSTLREKKPFVLVGEGGETVADIRTAALVATRLLELNASAVCDIYEMRVQDRHEWVKRFLDALVHAPKALWHPVLIVIDESHSFCPERGYGESVASQSVIDICNLGRKRGFCPILATQRLSKLNKNAAEPLQNYLVGRTTFDDQQRAASTFKIPPGAATREFSLELERLKDGQFIARGRAITGDMLKVQVHRGQTRPPATGTAMAGRVTPTPEAVKAFLPKLADLPHEAEKKVQDEEDLRRELVAAKRKIIDLERNTASTSAVESLQSRLDSLNNYSSGLAKTCDARGHALTEAAEKLEEIILDLRLNASGEKFSRDHEPPAPAPPVTLPAPPKNVIARKPEGLPSQGPGTPMGKACRSILTALAQHGICSKSKIAALTGYAVDGGGFNNALGELRTKVWIVGTGDMIQATIDGTTALGNYQPLPTGDELLAMWNAKLGKAERTVIQALLDRPVLTKDRLAEVTGYAADGGGFNNALGRLRTLELIEGKGELRLTPYFVEALRG
jgi:uncharacterized protein